MDVAARFGKNLTACRERADLSQEELAVRASVHRTEIGLLEKGKRLPRLDTLIKLAGGLSVPPADLLGGLVWKPGGTRKGRFAAGD